MTVSGHGHCLSEQAAVPDGTLLSKNPCWISLLTAIPFPSQGGESFVRSGPRCCARLKPTQVAPPLGLEQPNGVAHLQDAQWTVGCSHLLAIRTAVPLKSGRDILNILFGLLLVG